MTLPSDTTPTPEPILREALQWHVRLSETPDDRDLQREFDHWKAQDKARAMAWEQACHVMGVLEQGRSVTFLPVRRKPVVSGKRRLVAFAATAAAVLMAFIMAPQVDMRIRADHITGTAQQQLITLEDGSTVRLGPDSALRINYRKPAREVELLAGEAYFEVRRDPQRPFSVQTKTARVSVLGTGFNVRTGQAGADVAVKHGRVRVDYPEGDTESSAILTQGQWLRYGGQSGAVRGEGTPANVGSWDAQRLVAIGQPVSEVLTDLRRYYGGLIIVTDKTIGQRIVTGSYDVKDPALALRTIIDPVGGKVTEITPWVLVVSK